MRTIAMILSVSWMVVGCGDSGSSNNPSGRGNFGECFGSSGQTCTGVDTFETCVESHCDSQAQACFGSGYKSGNFGGSCGGFIGCTTKCACGDTTCQSGCLAQLTSDCTSCSQTFSSCEMSSGCAQPVCTGGSTPDAPVFVFPDAPQGPHADAPPGGGGADAPPTGTECTMLAACCPNLPAQEQPTCNQVVALGNEQACQASFTAFGCH
jgi:hypothetical protein